MSTLGVLHDLTTVRDPWVVGQFNAQEIEKDLFFRYGTRVSGVAVTTLGTPTAGTWQLRQVYRDGYRAEFVCVTAGTPGTWVQLSPAVVTSNPGAPTTGYWIVRADLNFAQYYWSGAAWVQIGGSSAHTIQEEGVDQTTRTKLNFVGGSVTASDNSGAGSTDVTVVDLRAFVLENPVAGENITVFATAKALTITSVKAICKGSSPSVTFNLKYGTDRSAGGTSVFSSDQTITATTALATPTINNSSIPANGVLWLTTSAASGTITDFTLAIELQ